MPAETLYKSVLLDHFHHPRNRGDLSDAHIVRRGSNPRCGDEVEVGVYVEDEHIDKVRFRGRGCSVCIASASMMTEAVRGKRTDEARHLCDMMRDWFEPGSGNEVHTTPEELASLSAVRDHPARSRCVLLCWEALADAIDEL